jgi:DNA-binding protein YbaB
MSFGAAGAAKGVVMSVAMRSRSEQLELEERDARAAIRGAEIVHAAMRGAYRDVRRLRVEQGLHAECPDLEMAMALVTRAVERAMGRLENERSDAAERYERSPTVRNLVPVMVAANANGGAL